MPLEWEPLLFPSEDIRSPLSSVRMSPSSVRFLPVRSGSVVLFLSLVRPISSLPVLFFIRNPKSGVIGFCYVTSAKGGGDGPDIRIGYPVDLVLLFLLFNIRSP